MSEIRSETPGLGPIRVQIQTQSGCNGRCVFCPNPEVRKSDLPQGRMAPELFRKIVDELAELEPRRISPYLMNEPLLDLRLPEFVRYITEKVPRATTLVTSNGTLLKEEMGAALIDAGLKRLKVSLQSLDPETNRKLMGSTVDPEKVVANVLAFHRVIKQRRARRGGGLDLRISMIVTKYNADEVGQAHRFWKKHGLRLVTSALENRGGNIDCAYELNPHGMTQRRSGCIRPSREMCILWNGDAVLCCVDWWRTVVVGNVARQSVREVWNGDALNVVRMGLAVGASTEAVGRLPKICLNCTESAQPSAHRKGLLRALRNLLP